MEYNVDLLDGLDIYNENSLTLILKQIKNGSKVLEFGPAYGRMTRFLHENMGCQVSCVEINPKAKKSLEKYAEKVIIGNIEEFEWVDAFINEEFDCIIFADVLEHLVDPVRVLMKTKLLLSEQGKIFISVPNIAHSAVINSLYSNKLQYQDYGILDKTHLRFFALSTVEEMIKECGFIVCNRCATYYNDAMTGILGEKKTDDVLQWILNQRPYSNVYQFVYTLSLQTMGDVVPSNEIVKWQKRNKINLYIDTGDGFSEENSYEREIELNREMVLEVCLEKNDIIKNLRIDPLDASCICKLNDVLVVDDNGVTTKIQIDDVQTNALYFQEGIFVFDNNDPQFIVYNLNKKIKYVRVSLQILFADILEIQIFNIMSEAVQNGLKDRNSVALKLNQLNDELKVAKEEVERKSDEIQSIRQESGERANKVAELSYQLENCQENLKRKNDEIQSVRQESEERANKVAELSYQLVVSQEDLKRKNDEIKNAETEKEKLYRQLEDAKKELKHKEKKIFEKNLQIVEIMDLKKS